MLRTLGSLLGFLSALTLIITVLSLPWMLGGVVPLARLSLLVGTLTAFALSLFANLLQRKPPRALPAILIPLVAMAVLGIFQLRPATESPAALMDHAVREQVLPADMYDVVHTLIPPDTRSTVSTLLALSLLACVAFDQLRTPRIIFAASMLIFANGIAIASIGLTQIFEDQHFGLNERWTLGESKALTQSFSTFVNPNNAAGWLCLCVAVAGGWITWHLKPGETSQSLRRGRLRISFWGRIWQRIVEFLADLTVWQIITLTGAALIAAGVAASRSRGGIVALVVSVVVTAVCRSSIRRLPIVLLLLACAGAATFGVLQSLELDAGVVTEMETLKNLDEAAGRRPEHWMDSLNVVRDFPVFGTGLGSYRFATPAYLTHHTGVWFRNADNHYIDMIVEGGLVGLISFISVGIVALFTGFAAWRQSKTKTTARLHDGPRLSRRTLAGFGTAVVLATVSQAVSAFVDYGVGLPAASSLFVLIVAAAAGFLVEGNVKPSLKESGSVGPGAMMSVPLQLTIAAIAATFVADQIAAAKIDEVVVEGHQLLNSPVQVERLEGLHATRTELETRLRLRRDDAEGLRLLCRLANAEFRWKILQMGHGEALRENPKFSRLWDNVTVQVLISQLAEIERQQSLSAKRLRQQMVRVLDEVRLSEVLDEVQRRYPLMPRIAEERADIAVLTQDIEWFEREVAAARFADPSNGGTLFKLGSLALRCGRSEMTEEIWQHCLTLTARYRTLMLLDSRGYWSIAEALELFGPRDYVACVNAAEVCPDIALRTELQEKAEEFWAGITLPPSAETALVRANHLIVTNRDEEALAWLKSILEEHSNDVPLRRLYARLLEKHEHFVDATSQWHHILFLSPGDVEADDAIIANRKRRSSDNNGDKSPETR